MTSFGHAHEDFAFRPGQELLCKVVRRESGGYAIRITYDQDNQVQTGFLATMEEFEIGQFVSATFVCVHEQRNVFSAISSPKDDPESNLAQLLYRRSTDLIVPPLSNSTSSLIRIDSAQIEMLLTWLDEMQIGKFTGCIKVACDQKKSRAAALLYKGRAVGCIYSNRSSLIRARTAEAIQMMLEDVEEGAFTIQYDLPPNLVLAMSAQFIGYSVRRNENLDPLAWGEHWLQWCESRGQTGCICFALPHEKDSCYVYVHEGTVCGAFSVSDQRFSSEKEFVFELIQQAQDVVVESHILPLKDANWPDKDLGYVLRRQ